MKIYVRQVNPEFQGRGIFDNELNGVEHINVCGNTDYKEHTSNVFKRVKSALDNGELAEAIKDIETDGYYSSFYKTITEVFNDLLKRNDGKNYSRRQIGKLKQLILKYDDCKSSEQDHLLVDVLSIVTGEEWDYKMIYGNRQSDWNTVYYPVQYWTKESLEAFEIIYFNTGSEWIIHDGDMEPTSPEEIDGLTCYCVSWNDDGIKKELAEAAGGNAEDVILYKYRESTCISTYKIA